MEEDSAPYQVMELLEGRSLRDAIDNRAPFSVAEKAGILGEIARSLAYAHRSGVIHRDIKPANIMLLANGGVKILDFGIGGTLAPGVTRQTSADITTGTPEYMAPEQYEGRGARALSDIYAFGVVAYEWLTGVQPFRGANPANTMSMVMNTIPPPVRMLSADCPEALESVVRMCMAKRPAERYRSMEEVLFDLGPIEAAFRKDRVDGMVAEAQRLLEAGDSDSAQRVLGRALELEPGHPAGQELRRRMQRGR